MQGQPRSQHGPNKAESSNCALPEGLLVFLSFALISLSLSLSFYLSLHLSRATFYTAALGRNSIRASSPTSSLWTRGSKPSLRRMA